jgi:hypothetical protein
VRFFAGPVKQRAIASQAIITSNRTTTGLPVQSVRRYQRERPGERIYLDIKTSGRLDQPGHRITGSRMGRAIVCHR